MTIRSDDGLTFGAWLKGRRKQMDLTQERLAERVGYSVDAIRKIESGVMRPSRQLAELLADCLQVTPTDRPSFTQWARSGGRRSATDLAPQVIATRRSRTNLKLPLTPLIGRERELAALHNLLLDQTVRLVTLTGPGGTGKTRLAWQVALDLLADTPPPPGLVFQDGVFFVSLAALSDPSLLASVIAQTLGVRATGDLPLLDLLYDYLRGKHMLLVLDNFEHVVTAAPLVVDLLATCAHLRVLTTSRTPLHMRGEQEFPVPPLPVPAASRLPPLEQLTHYASIQLFTARARAVRPDFILTETNAPAVAEICRRLDGLPLAIELAAAHIRLLSPSALLARLTNHLTLLTRGPRDLPTRQQTLYDTIAWSYNLLDEAEQNLFRRLAVFVGGCTLEAAEAVCDLADTPPIDIFEGMASLVDKNLLRLKAGEDDPQRFDMLETIRQYASDRLRESGEATQVRQRHLSYYVQFAETDAPQFYGAQRIEWLERCEIEHDNYRAALAWGLEHAAEAALRLAGALAIFWEAFGYREEGRRWLQAALERVAALPAVGDADGRRRRFIQARGLLGLTRLAAGSGDGRLGLDASQAAIRLYQELGDREGLGIALSERGYLAHVQGAIEIAEQALAEAIAIGREIDHPGLLARTLGIQSNLLLFRRGDVTAARAVAEESVRMGRATGLPLATGMTVLGLARIAAVMGRWDEARAGFHEAAGLVRELRDPGMVATIQSEQAHLERRTGQTAEAERLYQQCLDTFHRLGQYGSVAHELECLAFIARAQDQLPRAARLLGAAEALRETMTMPMTGYERTEYEREVAELSLRLEPSDFTLHWREGRSMTPDQAVAFALEGRD